VRRHCQVYQLNRPLNLGVDIFDLAEFGARQHILDVAPPIALLADFLQHLPGFLKLFLHRFHLILIECFHFLEIFQQFLQGHYCQVKLGYLFVVF
jgi:hypothetical protein